MEKKETVGKISSDLSKKPLDTRDPIALQKEMQKEYIDHLMNCVLEYRADHTGQDFYIVVITKREKLMPNVFRNYFFGRTTCPTPDYDQALYRYDNEGEKIEFLWVIPDRETCIHFKENALLVHEEEKGLLKMVLDFADGSLFRLAKKLNGEELESSKLEDHA